MASQHLFAELRVSRGKRLYETRLGRGGRAALATYRVLRRNGVEVELPRVECCGLPCHSAGDLDGARALARRNLAVLRTSGAKIIVIDESSCGSHLRHLDELGIATPGPLPMTVGWHDPCHLRHHEGVIEAPRRVIRQVVRPPK